MNSLLRAGNVFYGGNLGPLREIKTLRSVDCRGREIAYINNVPILEKAFLLHLALTLKSILLTVVCLSTFFDIFFVASDYDCDESKYCYILDEIFTYENYRCSSSTPTKITR